MFMAIRNAVAEARRSNGFTNVFRFDSPATAERIRLSCKDHIVEKVKIIKIIF